MVAPEFGMGPDEAKEIAKALHDVNRHYGVKILDQKTIDWVSLAQVVGVSYIGRLMAIRERKKLEHGAKVIPIRPVAQPQRPLHNDQNIPGMEPSPQQMNGADMRRASIPGVADVQFPADHDLSPRKVN